MSSSSFLALNKLVVTLQALSVVAARHTDVGGDFRSETHPAGGPWRYSRNEKSDILTSCLLVGGVLFRPLAIRHGVPPDHKGHDTPGS